VLESFKSAGGGAKGLEHVVTIFGVSKTALANHLMNVSHNQIVVDPKEVGYLDTDEWEASESLAVPVFNPQSVPISRRGQFANYVRKALQRGLISRDTAASLYQCALSDLDRAVESTKNFVAPLEEQLA
jgi:hypothetical protein